MDARKAHLPAELEAFLELGIGLPRKSGDNVRRDRDVRDCIAQTPDGGAELIPRVAPSHAFETTLAAALQREVEVTAQPGVRPLLYEVFSKVLRLDRGHADARHARLGEKRTHE